MSGRSGVIGSGGLQVAWCASRARVSHTEAACERCGGGSKKRESDSPAISGGAVTLCQCGDSYDNCLEQTTVSFGRLVSARNFPWANLLPLIDIALDRMGRHRLRSESATFD